MTLRTIQHNIKMKRLRKKFYYVIGKMMEHEHDTDLIEWKAYATLNLMYLQLMDNEVNEYAHKIKSR